MILVCLECGQDMREIKQDKYCCPACRWEAEQLSIEQLRKGKSHELESSYKTRTIHCSPRD